MKLLHDGKADMSDQPLPEGISEIKLEEIKQSLPAQARTQAQSRAEQKRTLEGVIPPEATGAESEEKKRELIAFEMLSGSEKRKLIAKGLSALNKIEQLQDPKIMLLKKWITKLMSPNFFSEFDSKNRPLLKFIADLGGERGEAIIRSGGLSPIADVLNVLYENSGLNYAVDRLGFGQPEIKEEEKKKAKQEEKKEAKQEAKQEEKKEEKKEEVKTEEGAVAVPEILSEIKRFRESPIAEKKKQMIKSLAKIGAMSGVNSNKVRLIRSALLGADDRNLAIFVRDNNELVQSLIELAGGQGERLLAEGGAGVPNDIVNELFRATGLERDIKSFEQQQSQEAGVVPEVMERKYGGSGETVEEKKARWEQKKREKREGRTESKEAKIQAGSSRDTFLRVLGSVFNSGTTYLRNRYGVLMPDIRAGVEALSDAQFEQLSRDNKGFGSAVEFIRSTLVSHRTNQPRSTTGFKRYIKDKETDVSTAFDWIAGALEDPAYETKEELVQTKKGWAREPYVPRQEVKSLEEAKMAERKIAQELKGTTREREAERLFSQLAGLLATAQNEGKQLTPEQMLDDLDSKLEGKTTEEEKKLLLQGIQSVENPNMITPQLSNFITSQRGRELLGFMGIREPEALASAVSTSPSQWGASQRRAVWDTIRTLGGVVPSGITIGQGIISGAMLALTGIISWATGSSVGSVAQVTQESLDFMDDIGLPQVKDYLNNFALGLQNKVNSTLGMNNLADVTEQNIDSSLAQRGEQSAGKLRPKFIMPSTEVVDEPYDDIKNQQLLLTLFNYVEPSSEGAEGTIRTNPLKKLVDTEHKVKYAYDIDQYTSTDTFSSRNLKSLEPVDLSILPRMSHGDLTEDNTIAGDLEQMNKYPFAYTGNRFQDPYAGFSNAYPSDAELRTSVLYTLCP